MGAIYRRPFQVDAVLRRLDDGVLLGMHCPADLVSGAGGDVVLISQAAKFQTVSGPGRGAVITCGQDVLVFDRDGPDMMPPASASLGHHRGDFEEIFVDAGPHKTGHGLFVYLIIGSIGIICH